MIHQYFPTLLKLLLSIIIIDCQSFVNQSFVCAPFIKALAIPLQTIALQLHSYIIMVAIFGELVTLCILRTKS